jgi:hypothetical protein
MASATHTGVVSRDSLVELNRRLNAHFDEYMSLERQRQAHYDSCPHCRNGPTFCSTHAAIEDDIDLRFIMMRWLQFELKDADLHALAAGHS